ncbi:hypothetical protein TrVE_jg10930 [Triparma verrucosa]|uniref:Cytochrome c peroxidase, mitochondrial n=1 Tax=Triparma verrucosa TaxID=1606542 RepID=A0A9W7BI45_9STRA|nr:hypothetical protein TrVE_jg10930 [Triparma verrucosa]
MSIRSFVLFVFLVFPHVEGWNFQFSSRRSILKEIIPGTAAITFLGNPQPSIAASKTPVAGKEEIEAIRNDILNMIKSDENKGPTLIRLAWHSSGTYSKMSQDGGSSGGTIRFKSELLHGANAGLAVTAVPWMEKIHKRHPQISYADLYTLGGSVAVEALGGPPIPWRSGRSDSGESSVTPNGRLPAADSGPPGSDKSDSTHLRTIFSRMGFDDRAIVALSGAHALGRCHTSASGYDGPWSPTPTTFNNSYFKLLCDVKWTPREWDGPFQYSNGKGGSLMMLPSDIVLIEDQKFKKWVKVYAKDEKKFRDDFSMYFSQLMELGCNNLVSA